MDDLISEFIGETTESLSALRRELGSAPVSHDTWEQAYKLVHTIKGTCGFLGLKRLEHVAGSTELLLQDIRDGKTYASQPVVAVVSEAVAKLDAIVQHLSQYGSEPPGDDRSLLAQLQNLPSEAAPVRMVEPEPEPEPKPEPIVVEVAKPAPRPMPELTPAPTGNLPATREQVPEVKPKLAPRAAKPEAWSQVLSGMVSVRNQLKTLAIASNTNRLDGMIGKLTTLVRTARREAGGADVQQVMVITSGSQRFAFLQEEIAEVLKIKEAQLSEADMPMLRHQGTWLPIKSLRGVLGRGSNHEEPYALVLRSGRQKVAVAIEQLGLLEEVQVSAWPPIMRDVPLYHGATLLGDNNVCLVVSAAGLMSTSGARYEPPARSAQPPMDTPLAFAGDPPPAAKEERPATPYLLFDTGDPTQKAIPLSEVMRVEYARAEEVSGNSILYRGQKLRLLSLPGTVLPSQGHFQIILLNAAPESALIARATHGIVHESAPPALGTAQPPYAGRMVMNGKMSDIIDVRTLVAQAKEAA